MNMQSRRRRVLHPGSIIVKATLISAFLLSSATVALAQTPPPKDPPAAGSAAKSKEGKKTSVNFEDQLIEGQTQKPELFYLLQNRNNNFKRLIKLRENFLPEMRKTAEDVGRKDATVKGSAE